MSNASQHAMTNDTSLRRYEHLYIDGTWVKPIDGELAESIDPATGRPWAIVPMGGPQDIDRAVAAARAAFNGPWRRMPGHERAALLRRLAERFSAAVPELAIIESRDNGNLVREHRASLAAQVQWYQWFASLADKAQGTTIPIDDSVHAFTTRVPIGVVGAIIPWNAPLLATCLKIGAALAAGCTVVVKPAEQTPVSALAARLIHEAGFPPGVFNVVPGYGRTAGAHLVRHPDVDKISFTGASQTAKQMVRDGADNLKRFTFELGGKAPHILFADADLDNAINAATASAWRLTGQSCALGSRVLVERSIYERVVDAFCARAKSVRVGMPSIDTNHMGPVASGAARQDAVVHRDRQAGRRGTRRRRPSYRDARNRGRLLRWPHRIRRRHEPDARRARRDFRPGGLAYSIRRRRRGRRDRQRHTLWPDGRPVDARRRPRASRIRPYRRGHGVGQYLLVPALVDAVWRFQGQRLGTRNGIDALDPYLETRTTVISTTGQFPNLYAD